MNITKEQLQQIRDALEHWHEIETASGNVIDYTDELDILDAELAKAEQEPMYFGLTHDHTWLSVTPSCYKKLKPEMRMKVYTSPPTHYDQTALELCEACGWKTLIPGDCCLNCERGKVEQEPVAAPEPQPVAMVHMGRRHGMQWFVDDPLPNGTLLYTAPVATPQREWVGLTDEQENQFVKQLIDCGVGLVVPLYKIIEKIDTALKEKNHG